MANIVNLRSILKRSVVIKEAIDIQGSYIDRNAMGIVNNILLKIKLTRHTTTSVGVHIRRGDMINFKYYGNYGYEVATTQY